MDHVQEEQLGFLLWMQGNEDTPLSYEQKEELQYLIWLSQNFTYASNYNTSKSSSPFKNLPTSSDHQNEPSGFGDDSNLITFASSDVFDNDSLTSHHHGQPSGLAYNNHTPIPAFSPVLNNPHTTNPHTTQPEQQPQARSSFAMPTPDVAPAYTRGPANATTTPSSSHVGDASHAGAAAIVPQDTGALPPPGIDGLRFDSYATASAASDIIFRAPVKAADDDIVEVEQSKTHHVKSLMDALKHDGFMPPPDEWLGEKNKVKALDETQKDDWRRWQEGALKSIRAYLKMPNIGVKLECTAWEIFEEILKVHRTGSKYAKQAKGSTSRKCSQRVQDAIAVMQKFAIVRLKLLNGDKIPNFSGNPEGYAKVTYRSCRNNCGRRKKNDQQTADDGADESQGASEAGKSGESGEAVGPAGSVGAGKDVGAGADAVTNAAVATGTCVVQGRRGASENGAVAHLFMSSAEVRERKRKAEKAVNGGCANASGHQKQSAVTTTKNTRKLPSSVDEHASVSSGEMHPINRSSMLPPPRPSYDSSGTPWSQPTQSDHNGSMAPPPSTVDNTYDFGGPFGSSAKLTPMGIPGRSINGLAAGTRFTFASPTVHNSFETTAHNPFETTTHNPFEHDPIYEYTSNRMLSGMPHQHYREIQTLDPSRRAAGSDAVTPGARSTEPSTTHGGMPEENANKRRKI
jgi:hypothetical protein